MLVGSDTPNDKELHSFLSSLPAISWWNPAANLLRHDLKSEETESLQFDESHPRIVWGHKGSMGDYRGPSREAMMCQGL